MNPRISELIKQATVTEPYYPAGNDGHPEYRTYVSQEKFAELVVKECARVQHKRFCEHGDVSWDILMQHFGVKE